MRTARSLTVSLPGCRPPRMQTPLDAHLPLDADHPPDADPPSLWTEGITHVCENITLPQTSFADGNNSENFFWTYP